jgi:DNA-binding response OmpR family regulator
MTGPALEACMSERKKILVVDDDPTICLVCRTVLEASGYQVFTASTGAEGLATARSESPDLVILDIMMEQVDSGFQAARALHELNPALPILMLSSIANASSKVFDTSSLPVKLLLDKPIEPKALVAKVELLLG